MITKVCFKCGQEKPIDEFYRHPQMKDGRLNKCKECTKNDIHLIYQKNSLLEEYVDKERQRGRDKYKRLYSGLHEKSTHPENRATRSLLMRRGVDCTGKEVHHWNYNRKNDVFLLNIKAHKLLHRNLTFDPNSNMFMFRGKLINSVEEHQQVMEEVLKPVGYTFEHYSF